MLSTVYRDTLFTATAGKYTSKEEGEQAFALIQDKPFEVTDVQKKQGKEAPRQLYDLTSLQVDCNRKFSFSAEMTLNLIQALYEKKLTTYPRVDTQYLSDDIYPKCPGILNGISQMAKAGQKPYLQIIKDLAAISKKLPKSKRVFDTSKVTDHHAIIPTGQVPGGLSDAEMKVYDLIARRFIAVFYPDCKFSTTTVKGKVDKVEFKTSGKEILSPGWRAVYAKDELTQTVEEGKPSDEEKTLPTFVKGESGPHKPTLTEKMTQPPKHYTEASLLRAMETAGKFVDDEELRAAMKENGIGRPSSRAGIIETLFKRHYIRRERKNLVATPTGIQLIDTIHEKLLTSCELTGIWEKKLRDIEHHKYSPQLFIDGLKEQVTKIVQDVLHDNSNRQIASGEPEPTPKPSGPKKGGAGDAKQSTKRSAGSRKKSAPATAASASATATPTSAPVLTKGKLKVGDPCPKCHQGHIIQGKTALGCSRWREGCDFRQPL